MNREIIPAPDGEPEDQKRRDAKAAYLNTLGEAVSEHIRKRVTIMETPPQMLRFTGEVRRWYAEYFAKMGIRNVTWEKNIYWVKETADRNPVGSEILGTVQIPDLSVEQLCPVPLPEAIKRDEVLPLEVGDEFQMDLPRQEAADRVRDYLRALALIHEIYHAVAPLSIFVQFKVHPETGEKDAVVGGRGKAADRKGLIYFRHRDMPVSSVEEGLARMREEEGEPLARQAFEAGAHVYANLRDYVLAKDPRLNNEWARRFLRILNFDGRAVSYCVDSYAHSVGLVRYLAAEIPDFFMLAEQARLEGKTIALARAVERRFGRGSYKEIVTCDEPGARSLKRELATFRRNLL